MRSFISNRVQQVPPSGIRRFFDIAATMDDVISLGIGEPDFVTAPAIVEAGIASLRVGGRAGKAGQRDQRKDDPGLEPPSLNI